MIRTIHENIKCQIGRFGDKDCRERATIAESREFQVGNVKGISFGYFCGRCWARQAIGLWTLDRSPVGVSLDKSNQLMRD